MSIEFLGIYRTGGAAQDPLVFLDEYEPSSPYVQFSLAESHTASNTGAGSASANGTETLGGMPVDG
ncbi:MAG: hypothetical protein RLW61_10860 [Gammaproteobacteria bacterium]